MRTKYCPHCGSQNIIRITETTSLEIHPDVFYIGRKILEMLQQEHYHECSDCNETWEHHEQDS